MNWEEGKKGFENYLKLEKSLSQPVQPLWVAMEGPLHVHQISLRGLLI